MCFPQVFWCFTWSVCCVCDKYLSYDASNFLQRHKKNNLGCFGATGDLEMIFFWQIIGNQTSLTEQKIESSACLFRTLPCISSLMVRVTFSPPSDWTLMGSMSGLDVKERGLVTWERSSRANASVMVESANRSPGGQKTQLLGLLKFGQFAGWRCETEALLFVVRDEMYSF